MPLSEHEERILAEIERQLADEDPRFMARARRRPRGRWSRQARLRIAWILGILGVINVALLVVSIAFGALGMVLIFGAVLLAVTTSKEAAVHAPHTVPPDERT